ncbi:hypothetical protein [Microbispora corallina]|uniref:hypothetical protein n=1 Tax=Microbispora corallina TaxID=83302 RepID=UPI001951E79E|nr:hypothetical protein [Microbispora corallina]
MHERTETIARPPGGRHRGPAADLWVVAARGYSRPGRPGRTVPRRRSQCDDRR